MTKASSMWSKIVQPPLSMIDQMLCHIVPSTAISPMIFGFLNKVASPTIIPKKANNSTGTIMALPNRLTAFIGKNSFLYVLRATLKEAFLISNMFDAFRNRIVRYDYIYRRRKYFHQGQGIG